MSGWNRQGCTYLDILQSVFMYETDSPILYVVFSFFRRHGSTVVYDSDSFWTRAASFWTRALVPLWSWVSLPSLLSLILSQPISRVPDWLSLSIKIYWQLLPIFLLCAQITSCKSPKCILIPMFIFGSFMHCDSNYQNVSKNQIWKHVKTFAKI